MRDNHLPQTRPLSTYAKAALILLLSALSFQLSAQTNARLHFTYAAPYLNNTQISALTSGTYYSIRQTNQNPRNVLPVASCTNLPAGALSRTIYARVLYPSGTGTAALVQRAEIVGAVRFYRSGVQVGSLPYNTGYMSNSIATGACVVQPCLFSEFNFHYAATADDYRGFNLGTETDTRLLPVASAHEVDMQANGLTPLTVSIDCDTAELELDTLKNQDLVTWPATDMCVFLAVLSQPK